MDDESMSYDAEPDRGVSGACDAVVTASMATYMYSTDTTAAPTGAQTLVHVASSVVLEGIVAADFNADKGQKAAFAQSIMDSTNGLFEDVIDVVAAAGRRRLATGAGVTISYTGVARIDGTATAAADAADLLAQSMAALETALNDGSFLNTLQAADAAFAAVTVDVAATLAAIAAATVVFVVTTPAPSPSPSPSPTPATARPTALTASRGAGDDGDGGVVLIIIIVLLLVIIGVCCVCCVRCLLSAGREKKVSAVTVAVAAQGGPPPTDMTRPPPPSRPPPRYPGGLTPEASSRASPRPSLSTGRNFCTGCGQQLLEGASFCGNCGCAAPPSTRAQAPAPTMQELRVTVPDGCTAGQTIHVQHPDGRTLAIVLPPGSAPGKLVPINV